MLIGMLLGGVLSLSLLSCVSDPSTIGSTGSTTGEQNEEIKRESRRGILTTLKDIVDPIITEVSDESQLSNWLSLSSLQDSDPLLVFLIVGIGIALAALCAVLISGILV